MYALVIPEYEAKAVDYEYTYIVPLELRDKIRVGHRVRVMFNKRMVVGFVLKLTDSYDLKYKLNEIVDVVDDEPVLNDEMLYLGKMIHKKCLCSMVKVFQAMLPKSYKAHEGNQKLDVLERYISLNIREDEVDKYLENIRGNKQREIISEVNKRGQILVTRINSSIKALIDKGILKATYHDKYRYIAHSSGRYKKVNLNQEQQNVVNQVKLDEYRTYLLYGVTGSGKTEVYMELISRVLDEGKTAIMLVPEISLTPQIVDRFLTRFPNNVAVLHSGLSDGERNDEYRKIRKGLVRIVVGARSAVFAPLKNLGIVVVDEEHSPTYKQDHQPRYDARDVAIMRGEYNHAPVIFGSATPSLESFARGCQGVYKLLMLTKRANTCGLPLVHIVDMKEEIKVGNYIFSRLLLNRMCKCLNNHEQMILLLNRRGYSSIITCRDCGNVLKCPNCDISLTYHKSSDSNRCHYCNYAIRNIHKCPKCGSHNLRDYGLGTEKLEEEIGNIFNGKSMPMARVIRMDMDTTRRKGAYEQILNDFGEGKADILLGTQMIAKGIDFPKVTLVGVINADRELNLPDFRSAEKTFQLLSQVAGRAGRSSLGGEVVIQTYNPKHYSILYAKDHNYLGFYKEEMQLRKSLSYSPYFYITVVNIKSRSYDKGFDEANKIGEYLRRNLSKGTIVLGPSMANIFKINNIYNYQCIIKYKHDEKLVKVLGEIDNIYKSNQQVLIDVDVDSELM